MSISRSVYHYRSRLADQTPLVMRIKEIAAARVRYGYQRIHVVLRREGWRVNHKRVYRLYRREGLSLYERRPRRHRSAMQRQAKPAAQAINECWSMDFVSDQLYDGRKLRALTLIDAYTRECLAIHVDQGIRGDDVVEVLGAVRAQRHAPQRIFRSTTDPSSSRRCWIAGLMSNVSSWRSLVPANRPITRTSRSSTAPAPGVPESTLVLVFGRRARQDRSVARGV